MISQLILIIFSLLGVKVKVFGGINFSTNPNFFGSSGFDPTEPAEEGS